MAATNDEQPEVQTCAGQTSRARLQTAVVAADCLVVSLDAVRCECLARVAEDAGWHVLRTDNVETAWAWRERIRFRLAIVDLVPCRRPNEERLRVLAQRMAGEERSLLSVVGREGDLSQEVFARSIASWLYLPDIGDAQELVSVFRHARESDIAQDPTVR